MSRTSAHPQSIVSVAPAPAADTPRLRWWCAGAVAAAALVYLPALGNGFIWDDPLVLEQLRAIHGLRDLLIPPAIIPRFYYRPLIFLTYLTDRAGGGEQPFWFHFSVVAAHVLNTGLLCWLGVRLLGATSAVALGALLFAVHPVHVESVAWMAGRSDVIAAAFLLLSAGLLTYPERNWTGWAAVAAYALALLSKEVALAALVLLPLIDVVQRRSPRWTINGALAGATLLYLLLRRLALGVAVTGAPIASPIAATVTALLAAVGFYIRALFVPVGLSAYVPELPAGAVLPALAILAITGAVAIATRAARRGDRVTPWLLAWFFVMLAPSLIVIVRQAAQAPVADRYLYVPSLAASLLLAHLLTSTAIDRRWRLSVTVVLAVSGLFAVMSVTRNRVWADELLFWQGVTASAPAHAFGHRELAQAYLRRNQPNEAETELKQALLGTSDADGRVMTLNNLGNLYVRQQRLDQAEEMFRSGLTIHEHAYLRNGLGRLAMKRAELAQARGDSAEAQRQAGLARQELERCVALAPDDPKARALLGQVLYVLNDRAAARAELQRALQLGAEGGVADATRRYLKMLGPS